MKENYIYPAIVKKADREYEATVCDFDNAVTCGENQEEIISSLQELIALSILDLDSKNMEVPEPSAIEDISLNEDEQLLFIHIWMPYYKNFAKEVYVKKTLTIPQWLDILGKENDVNFSAVLTNALKKELGLETKYIK